MAEDSTKLNPKNLHECHYLTTHYSVKLVLHPSNSFFLSVILDEDLKSLS